MCCPDSQASRLAPLVSGSPRELWFGKKEQGPAGFWMGVGDDLVRVLAHALNAAKQPGNDGTHL